MATTSPATTGSSVIGDLANHAPKNASADSRTPIAESGKQHLCSDCGKNDSELCWRKHCIRPGAGA